MVFNHKAGLAAAFLVFGIILTQPVHAQKTIDFEGLNDSTPVTTQYSAFGVTFSNATVLTAGVSLNEQEFPPKSGSNVVFDDGGPITGAFSTPVHSLSGYFTYTSPLTFTAFDSLGNSLTSVSSLYSDNTTSSGNAPNEFLQLSSPFVISSFTIAGDPAGGSFTLDDLHFSPTPSTPVPEMTSALSLGLLLLLAGGGFCLRSRPTRFLRAFSWMKGHALPLPLLPCVATACFSLLIALPAQAARSVATPTANADYVFVNEPQTVTITAQISPDPNLITTAVKLVRVNSAGTVLGVFPMYDDGTHGDAVAGDGLYTAQVRLDETATGTAIFYVTTAYKKSLLRTKSQPLDMRVVVHLNQAQVAEYVNSLTAAGNEYAVLLQTEPASQARKDLVKYVLTLPDVASAGITADGATVYFMIFGNLEEDVETDLPNYDSSSSASALTGHNSLLFPLTQPKNISEANSLGTPIYQPLVGNRKALCIGAYYDGFSKGGGDELDYIGPKLKEAGMQVDAFINNQATVNVFKTMSDYGVVCITSHGYIADDGNVNIDTRERVNVLSIVEHLADISAGLIHPVEIGTGALDGGHWAITPAFVSYYGTDLFKRGLYPNSLIYVGGCFSYVNNTMLGAFMYSGASAYFGYTDDVSTRFSHDEGVQLFKTLANEFSTPADRTAQIAYTKAGPTYVDPYYKPGSPYYIVKGPATFKYDRSQPDLALDINFVDHITITPVSPSIEVGATLPLTATAYDATGNVVMIETSELQWSSDKPTIATVDANSGIVTGVAAGTATITVTDSVSGKSEPVIVTVTAPPNIVGAWKGTYDFPAIIGGGYNCPEGHGSVDFTFQKDNSVAGSNKISGTIYIDGAAPYSGPNFHGTQTGASFSVTLDGNANRVISGTINGTSLTANSTIDCVDSSGIIQATGPISFDATLQSTNGNLVRGHAQNQGNMTPKTALGSCFKCNANGHHRSF